MKSGNTYEDFLDTYDPIPSESGDDLRDTSDPLVVEFQNNNPRQVWTLFRGPWDDIYVKAGYHPDSSLGYFIAGVPRESQNDEESRFPFAPA
jgi:hypothetical protein